MKKVFVTKEQIEKAAEKFPTPFHIYDERGIRENAKAVNEAFSWNPGYREYFAVKANANPYLMDILRQCGCGFDCSSAPELVLSGAVLEAPEEKSPDGSRIMFSSNDTPEQEYAIAARMGAIINLDDITMVAHVENALRKMAKEDGREWDGRFPKTMSCRYNPGGVFAMSNDYMDNPGEAKYGMTHDQILQAFSMLKERGVEEFGIHAFLVSNTTSNDYYPALAGKLFELAVELQDKTGVHISFVNLSGGVGIPYRPEDKANDIRVIGEGVRRKYEEILVPAGMGDVSIYTEMGRFMMGPYGALVTKAINEKHIYKEYIGTDACAANLMRPAMYGAYHHITVLGKENAPCTHVYDVTGSLCENNDKFAVDRKLPEIEMGDYLYIHDTGAHGFSMGYNYNAKLRSAELLLQEDGSIKEIRRAETARDYFATLDGTPYYNRLDFRSLGC
ncbi:MAG: diaminopimelate decarboxylase [Lachnospiraceae bacterium]|jgi:diaminopimelate decarboxylase|nr:diaminopimelate decarboxylase [Lachnospiraceae bacterium]